MGTGCVHVLYYVLLSSSPRASPGPNWRQKQRGWKSVAVCQHTDRLCDVLEANPLDIEVSWDRRSKSGPRDGGGSIDPALGPRLVVLLAGLVIGHCEIRQLHILRVGATTWRREGVAAAVVSRSPVQPS